MKKKTADTSKVESKRIITQPFSESKAMDAYSTISKIDPHNPVVMLRASDFCDLFDGRLNPEDKKNLLDHVANQLKAKKADSK